MPETLESLASDASPKLTLQVQPDLQMALQAGTEAPFVLVILSSLETALVAALGAGMPPSEALARETAQLEEQLVGLRPHRRQILVLERSAMQADPAACAALLSDRLGCAFETDVTADPSLDLPRERPLQRLMARVLVHENSLARRLEDELEASIALAADETDKVAQLDRLHAALKEDQSAQAIDLGWELEQREAEVQLLLANVAQLEEQMQEDSLELGLQQSLQSGMAVEGGRRTVREEILGAALLRSLSELQRGREAEALLDGVYRSTSWRLTSPMRTVRRGFRKP
ncbi:hypothetical protein KUV62_22005 [Salipiger bermudensis]|uniref:hypothetical protein n=1 Tax=Salipiger bermudensis TaxID=344736 RepID=UPI001C996EBF|nr:hypothetical protein [Salipiger bermudensis]MBY6006614.1 hypothetical protein [Salipiger bermudensis]